MKALGAALSIVVMTCACNANPLASADHEEAYVCADGQSIAVRYSPANGTAVLTRHGERIELQQQPSGSGVIYSNGPNTIRGKGDELMLEIGRMAPIQCKAKTQ